MRKAMMGVETEWHLFLERKMDRIHTEKYGVISTPAEGSNDGTKAFFKECEDHGIGIAGAAISLEGTTFFFRSGSDLTAARLLL